MSNIAFSIKKKSYNSNIQGTNNNIQKQISNESRNLNMLKMSEEKLLTTGCNNCPTPDSTIIEKDINLEKLQEELLLSEKRLNNLTSKTMNKSNKTMTDNIIGFKIIQKGNNYLFKCIPTHFLNINGDYTFEDISIVDKNNKYVSINNDMIINNSKDNFSFLCSSDFYENVKSPFFLNGFCLSKNAKMYVIGFLL